MRNETPRSPAPEMSTGAPILIAVDDALLHPEATHLAAATGHPLIDARTPGDTARHFARAYAVFVDAERLTDITDLPPRQGVFLLRSDSDFAAGHADAQSAFVLTGTFALPAEAALLLKALGRLALETAGVQHAPRHHPENRAMGTVITTVGAVGGAGTSTLVAAIARVAAPEVEPIVVDAHRYSGGLDLLFGIEDEVGARWGDIAIGEGRVDRSQIRHAVPTTRDGIGVLTASRTTVAEHAGPIAADLDKVTAVLGAGGLTVVDAPAGLQAMRTDHTVIVVPAEVRAAAAAALIAAECRAASVPVSVVLRHRGWSGMSADDVAHVTKCDVIAELKHVPRLVKATEMGGLPLRLPGPLVNTAEAVLGAVA